MSSCQGKTESWASPDPEPLELYSGLQTPPPAVTDNLGKQRVVVVVAAVKAT